MGYLTKQQIKAHRAWLTDWHLPTETESYVAAVNWEMGAADFFCQGGLAFIRDAFAAAQFGRFRGCARVRLVPELERWPDFEVQLEGINAQFECVEADQPDRRRCQEYREAARRAAAGECIVEHDSEEAWCQRADQILPVLNKAVKSKINKKYAGRVGLLIYVNLETMGIRQQEIVAGFPEAVAPALPHFTEVSVLWNGCLHGPWRSS